MVATGISLTLDDIDESSQILGSLIMAIYILGYAVGELFLRPLSETYGRYPAVVLLTGTFNTWLLGNALAPNMSGLIAMRLLAGIGGSAVTTISPAIVANLYPVE